MGKNEIYTNDEVREKQFPCGASVMATLLLVGELKRGGGDEEYIFL